MLDMSIIDCEGSRAIDWMMKLSYFVRPITKFGIECQGNTLGVNTKRSCELACHIDLTMATSQ